jgi:prevent-host-death family protein
MTTTAEVKDMGRRLAELVERVRAGDDVLLTQENKPVARLVPVSEQDRPQGARLKLRSLKGHRVLTPVIPQAEIAEELFGRQ